jgi:superfamily II DNA helicase RecQ
MARPIDILKRYFGYESFRPGQEEVIDTLLEGRDCLAIMPTGAGSAAAGDYAYRVASHFLDEGSGRLVG